MKLDEIIGVIFDFNGTMFYDSKMHLQAWKEYIEETTGIALTAKGVERYIANKSGKEILEYFLKCELPEDMVDQFCEEKEGIYRRICASDEAHLKLAPGLTEFLDFLAEHNVPRTIATTANLSNVMFYFERFDLYQWFDPEKIVYHNKKLRDKPYPDQYLVACKLLNKEPARCLVFEDSVAGIVAANNAGIKNIVAVTGDNSTLSLEGLDNIRAVIKDYYELNETLKI